MSRLRLLFFWLLVLAVPLQGFAATTKLLCGGAATTERHHLHMGVTAGGHAHGHQADASGQVAPHAHPDTGASAASGLDGPGHQCGLCAACCHAVALSARHQVVIAAPVPHADGPELVARVPDRTSRLPDKPPRA